MKQWHQWYRNAVMERHRPTALARWVSDHFPDMGSVEQQYRDLGGNFGWRLP
jgi:hypothetical protein